MIFSSLNFRGAIEILTKHKQWQFYAINIPGPKLIWVLMTLNDVSVGLANVLHISAVSASLARQKLGAFFVM